MRGIGKSFPGVRALDRVDFSARPGEILALMGENGAGKSTLMKVLSGVIPFGTFDGELLLDSKLMQFKSTTDARCAGIAIIHQELNLFGDMSVADNLLLGLEPLRVSALSVVDGVEQLAKAREALRNVGLEDLDLNCPVNSLSVGQQQLIEIARAMATGARVLIFDEPTSALSAAESQKLFSILKDLKSRGHTLIYISHRMEEVFQLADSIVVLRDGRSVGELPRSRAVPDDVIRMMVGRDLKDLYPRRPPLQATAREVLRVENLTVKARSPQDVSVNNVSFSVRAGEILGLAGLVGSGRSEVLGALFGALTPSRVSGQVYLEGKQVHIRQPRDAISCGMAFVTEDRKATGLLLERNIDENMLLAAVPSLSAHFVMDDVAGDLLVRDYFKRLRIKAPSSKVEVRTLSGGNQQKIVLAKWLALNPKVVFLDEPTRGIDVGARQEIYQFIAEIADSGAAVVIVSSDLPEVLGLSDRVLVMRDGHGAGLLERREANQQSVMSLAAGVN